MRGTVPARRDIGSTSRVTLRRGLVGGFLLLLSVAAALSIQGGAASATPAGTSSTMVLQGDAKSQVDALQGQADEVQSDIDRMDVQLEMLSESYNELTVRLEQTNQDLSALRRRLQDSRGQYDYRRAKVDERLVAAYKSGDNSFLEILFSTHDFSSFVKRLVLLYHVSAQDRQLVEDVKVTVSDLSSLEQEIDQKKSDELALRHELEQKQAEIETTLAERTTTLAGLDTQIAARIEEERIRQEAERKRLEDELRAQLRARLAVRETYNDPAAVDRALIVVRGEGGEQVNILSQLVETAAAYLGVPYVWAGEHPSTGMDCSGFTRYVYRQHGIELPHYSGYQAQMGVEVPLSEVRAGDLLAFGATVHHVGIYIGDGKFIHAPRTGDVIRVARLADRNDLNTIRRFPLQLRQGDPQFD